MYYKTYWQSKHHVCRAHFPGGRRYGTNNIPAIFPRKDKRTGQIVGPVDISYLLNAEATEATWSSSNKTENADVVCLSCEQVESEASDQQSEDTRREKVAKDDSHSEELSPEKACDFQMEIDELKKRIKDLKECREVEKFGVRRFIQVTLTLDFTPDFLIMQLSLLCIILLNQNQDLDSTTIMTIPMLLKLPLILFHKEGHGICVNSMNFFLH